MQIYKPLILGRTDKIKDKIIPIADLNLDYGKVAIEGRVVFIDSREIKNGKILAMFNIYDGTSTIACKAFLEKGKAQYILERINESKRLRVAGNLQYDNYSKDLSIIANVIAEIPEVEEDIREDLSDEKRVELHVHTQMSQLDGVSSAASLIKKAASWRMKAIAITDHGVCQAFPEAKKASSDLDIKVIYGVEAYLVPDCIAGTEDDPLTKVKNLDEYCVLDIETTGLQFRTEKITEIGAMKIKNGQVVDEFKCFVNPERHISEEITRLTGITDSMVADAETIKQVLPKFLDFIGEDTLIAHNADFDVGFIRHNAEMLNIELKNDYIDTLSLSRQLFPGFTRYKLGSIAENLGIKVENAHRALDDVKTLVQVFEKMRDVVGAGAEGDTRNAYKAMPSYHAIILVKNQKGLKNLYKLISISHLDYFYKKPLILKSIYKKYSSGLIMRKCV